MRLQALFILAEIDKCGSKRKVAEMFAISIDTINKYIAVLEDELGYELLKNSGKGAQLTLRGKELVKHADIIEDSFYKIFEDKPDAQDFKGEVLISMPLSVSTNLFPENIYEFFEQYPDINLVTHTFMDNTDFSDMDSDVGLTFLPPNNDDITIIHTKKVECGYFVSPKYLEKYGVPESFEDMLENHWIITRVQLRNFIQDWRDVIRNAKHTRYITNSTFAATEMVRCGGGIAIMPLRFKKEKGFVCLNNFKCEEAPIIYLVAKNKSKNLPAVKAVLDFYKNLMDDM